MDSQHQLYDEKTKTIKKIQFSVLGNSTVSNMSVLGKGTYGITVPDLYDNMEAKKGGLIDPRLGTSNNAMLCATCGLNVTDCVGHFGHITMMEPVFNIAYLPYLKKILSCICIRCSKLLVYKNEDAIAEIIRTRDKKDRFEAIRNIVKNVTYCQKPGYGCGTKVSKIRIDEKRATALINIVSETEIGPEEGDVSTEKKKIRQILTPEICYDILKNMSNEDCIILGMDPELTRPESMIYKIFPVPPVAIRPSTRVDFMESSTKEDDLTHKLADIVKANNRGRSSKESSDINAIRYNDTHRQLLQLHVGTYIDNESLMLPKTEQRSKKSKGITERIKGKDGRFRGNLMGKRTDFAARTVITPDTTTDVDQVRIPLKIAMNLTIPEIVTPYNIEHLSNLVKNGRDVYPGANFVFLSSGITEGKRVLPIDLRYRKEKIDLRFGDVVERHMIDGDWVLLNRQPSLHKLSMMAHRVKVTLNPNLLSFGFGPQSCKAYNADFDGDK